MPAEEFVVSVPGDPILRGLLVIFDPRRLPAHHRFGDGRGDADRLAHPVHFGVAHRPSAFKDQEVDEVTGDDARFPLGPTPRPVFPVVGGTFPVGMVGGQLS